MAVQRGQQQGSWTTFDRVRPTGAAARPPRRACTRSPPRMGATTLRWHGGGTSSGSSADREKGSAQSGQRRTELLTLLSCYSIVIACVCLSRLQMISLS